MVRKEADMEIFMMETSEKTCGGRKQCDCKKDTNTKTEINKYKNKNTNTHGNIYDENLRLANWRKQ